MGLRREFRASQVLRPLLKVTERQGHPTPRRRTIRIPDYWTCVTFAEVKVPNSKSKQRLREIKEEKKMGKHRSLATTRWALVSSGK